MNVRYVVELTIEEREELEQMLAGGELGARKLKRAQVLLGSYRGLTDAGLSEALGVGTSTIYRTKRRYVEGGLAHALSEKQRPGARRKLSGREEALLVATACSKPPAGRAKWTMELLADEIVRLTDHDELSSETVRRRLKENQIKPWQKRMWCIPEVNPEFVARMEDPARLRALYAGPRRRALPRRGEGPCGDGQPLDPPPGGPLRDLRARRGSAHPAPPRVPLHAEARKLAQHG